MVLAIRSHANTRYISIRSNYIRPIRQRLLGRIDAYKIFYSQQQVIIIHLDYIDLIQRCKLLRRANQLKIRQKERPNLYLQGRKDHKGYRIYLIKQYILKMTFFFTLFGFVFSVLFRVLYVHVSVSKSIISLFF